jgi:iron complex outermembrane receptor protein
MIGKWLTMSAMTHSTTLFLLTLLPGLALAQEASQTLEPVVVSAKKESKTLTVPSPDQSREELQKSPGGTEVIEAERYLVGRSSTLADTFFLSPGVIAQPRFGSDEARISIRGSGLQRTFHGRGIRVLQDGVPINLADGGFDMQSLEPTAAHFINVWRGGNALAYGASTLGGAIDYVSHTGHSAPGGSLRTEAGSWGYQRTTLTGGWHDQNHDLFSALTYQRQDGFRRNAEQENLRLFQNFGWRIADDVETRFYLSAVQAESELPGALTRAQMLADPRQANPLNILRDQRRDYDLARLANKTTVRAGANTLEMFSAVTYKDLDHPIFQVIDQVSRDYLWGANITHQSTLFGRENRIKSGVIITHGETNAAQLGYASPTSSRRGALISDDDQVATNFEAFVEDQYEFAPGWTGVIGGIASHNKRKNTRRFGTTTAATNYDLSFDELAPKVGMRWDGMGMQFFANVSGSYEPPSFSEAITANIARRAQTALTYEIGTRGAKEFFRWDLALYHSEIQDELLAVLDPISNLSTTTNANETTHSGVELGTEIDLLGQSWDSAAEHRLVLSGAWTYGRFKFENHRAAGFDYSGNTIAGLPPHLVRGELMWRHSSGYYAGPIAEWVPQGGWVDHRNTLKADPYALIGFRVGRRVPDGVSWFVEGRNLTDKVHAATTGVIDNANGLDVAQFLPGDGIGAFAGIELQW